MQGSRSGHAVIALVGAIFLAAALVPGSAGARGGNHSCDAGDLRSDHFFAAGDNIVIGLYITDPSGPDPEGPQEVLISANTSSDAGDPGPSRARCSADPGVERRVTSDLGPGDDSVRLDGRGIEPDEEDPPPGPIRAAIDAELLGRGGADVIRGHAGIDVIKGGLGADVLRPLGGRDNVSGGGGTDVIRARDGKRDVVKCGTGRDRAVVDRRDEAVGCEDLRAR